MFGKDKKDNSEKKESIITRETIGFTLAVFSALILIILFTGSLIFGMLGESISQWFFGVFGFMSYFVFAGLFYLAVCLIAGRNFIPSVAMTVSLFVFIGVLGLLIHAILTTNVPQTNYGEYLSTCFALGTKGVFGCTPFGWFGSLIAFPFMALATPAGAYILLAAGAGLSGYLFVNAILIYTGIRPTTRRPRLVADKTEAEQAFEQSKPVTFADIQNDRQPQTASTQAPLQPVGNAQAVGYATQDLSQQQPMPQAGMAAGYKGYTSPSVGRELLYGDNQQADYRSRNLIFDEGSQYNNRPSAPSYYAPTTPSYAESTPSYGESSYIDSYTQSVDAHTTVNGQPREVTQETQTAQNTPTRSGYSQYREGIYGDYEEDMTETDVTPTPSYRAPSARPESQSAPTVPPVRANETTTDETRESGARSLRDLFGADSELQSRQTASSVEPTPRVERETPQSDTPFSGGRDMQTGRVDSRPSFGEDRVDRSAIFDDEEMEEEIEEEVTLDDLEDDTPVTPVERSRDSLSSTLRDYRNRGEADRGTPDVTPTPTQERRPPVVTPNTTATTGTATPVAPAPTPEPPKPRVIREYKRPSTALLDVYPDTVSVSEDEIATCKQGIVETLAGFNIAVEVVRVTTGPALTRYDITFPSNITVRTIARYADSIAMRLRVQNPVKVTSNYSYGTVAIEVPNQKIATVGLRSLLESDAYINARPNTLTFCVGKDVEGRAVCKNLCSAPHMLVAGTTGSGKSVFLHELIMSLIMRYSPEEFRLVLVDPKQTEFAGYEGLPHLLINEIITAAPKLIVTLNYLINEMERRNTLFRQMNAKGKLVRGIDEYNAAVDTKEERLPKIVLVADEVADMMSVAKKDIEDRISRLAAKARSAGIHLVLATQRPSTDVFTGVLKANLPSRFALRVGAEVDSRVIMDDSGAEKLLGRGDLLYKMGDMFAPERVQAAWVSPEETQRVCDYIRKNNESYYEESVVEYMKNDGKPSAEREGEDGDDGEVEPVYIDALRFVVKTNSASISMIQRKCSVGYNKAGKIIEWMEISGYISPFDGAKSRKVLLTPEEFEAKFGEL